MEMNLMDTGVSTNLEVNLKAEQLKLQSSHAFKMYDIIFIAILNTSTCRSIKQKLEDKGIKKAILFFQR